MRCISMTAMAQIRGPTVIGIRGPMRCANCPKRADSSSMITVTGSRAVPAAKGLKPATTCNCTASRKNTPPKPAYTAKVTALAALNCRDAKMCSGSIGCDWRDSATKKPARAMTPSPPVTMTVAEPAPWTGAAMMA